MAASCIHKWVARVVYIKKIKKNLRLEYEFMNKRRLSFYFYLWIEIRASPSLRSDEKFEKHFGDLSGRRSQLEFMNERKALPLSRVGRGSRNTMTTQLIEVHATLIVMPIFTAWKVAESGRPGRTQLLAKKGRK